MEKSGKTSDKAKLLLLGLDQFSGDCVRSLALGENVEFVERALDLAKLLEGGDAEVNPVAVLCGAVAPYNIQTLSETAQVIRSVYPDLGIFLVVTERSNFDRKILQKNGFTDAFLTQSDRGIMESTLQGALTEATKGEVRFYKQVNVIDIVPGAVLDFDLYLHMPANGKHVKYSAASRPIDEERAQRLIENKVTSVHITTDQIASFYRFTARQLKNLGQNSRISATELKERRERAVRDLLTGLFHESQGDGFERGREIISDCKAIVKEYICGEDPERAWYEKLMSAGEGSGPYNRSANVATYASLFSIGLGIGDPEHLAIAGLLHDIGLADIDPAIVAASERTPEQQKTYESHPERSVKMIQERKAIVPEKALTAIAQHHERYDGKGYPNKIPGHRWLPEAQLLAFADWFEHNMTHVSAIKKRSPADLVRELHAQLTANPGDNQFDPAFIKRILDLFEKRTQPQIQAREAA